MQILVAGTQNNLGILLSYAKRKEEAIGAFRMSIDMNGSLVKRSPLFSPLLEPWIANSWMNLGNVYREIGLIPEAGKAYEQALSVYRRLAEDNHAVYDLKVGQVQNNLGLLYADAGLPDAAEKAYLEDLSVLRPASESDPALLPRLAKLLINLGSLHRVMRRLEAAAIELEEGVGIFRRLASGDPRPSGELAWALLNLGLLHEQGGRLGQAEAALEESVATFRQLAAANPHHQVEVARVRMQQGRLLALAGRLSEADVASNEGLSVLRRLAAQNPLAHGNDLAVGLLTISNDGAGPTKASCALTEEALRVAVAPQTRMLTEMKVMVCRAVVLDK